MAKVLQNDYSQPITLAHVIQAKEELIRRRDTHLDSLIDKLCESRVRPVVEAILNGDTPAFDDLNEAILYTRDLGLIAPKPPVRFANPIYQEIISRVLSFGFEEFLPEEIVDRQWYIKDGRLDLNAMLVAFQEFYRENSEAWLEKYDFREVGRQLLLMAFLQRVVNAGGRIERKLAAGNGRCDLWLEYAGEQFVIELKLYRNPKTRDEGLQQITRYLGKLGFQQGYLIIFETRVNQTWEDRIYREVVEVNGKTVIVMGM